MRRRTFLAGTAAVAALVAAPAVSFAQGRDEATLTLLTTAADAQAAAILSPDAAPGAPFGASARGTLRQMRRLVTPFIWPQSRYFHDAALKAPIERFLSSVEAAQHDDGTFSGGNRHSPPDSAFLIEDMATMAAGLEADSDPASAGWRDRLIAMMHKAGPPLRTGGIHTPNHRWELSAALGKIDKFDPNPAYRARIDEWLAEGVDINAEGIYSERSSNYAQAVSNPSLLSLAHLPGLAGLRDLVRRNLETTIDMSEPVQGVVETIYSRRQDQAQTKQTLHTYYLQYRELAQRDNDGRFAGIVRWIEQNDPSQLADFLADFIAEPELAGPLPAPVNPFVDFARLYDTVNLVRERRGPITASAYAGSDWYDENGEKTAYFNRIGSGVATNPTLFRMWKGDIAVDAVRLIPDFFSTGHWRPSTIALADNGVVELSGQLKVPYYLPLPPERRRADGAYPLTPSVDGRFNSALDFPNRPAQFRELNIGVTVTPEANGYVLGFTADGEEEVDIAIEITLRDGGVLTGAQALPEGPNQPGGYQLVEGQAEYAIGDQRLIIGPGSGAGQVRVSSGETYSWAGGRLQLPGTRLYVTGRTPMRHDLRLAFA